MELESKTLNLEGGDNLAHQGQRLGDTQDTLGVPPGYPPGVPPGWPWGTPGVSPQYPSATSGYPGVFWCTPVYPTGPKYDKFSRS